jgi:aspartate aminotransferase
MELVAQRILNLSESETLAMTRRCRELAAQGIEVINLSIGEPDFNTPDNIKEAAIKAINENRTHYPPVPGFLELRKAICAKLKRDNNLEFTPEQIVVSTGAKHSIANAIISMVNPGEEVLLPAPYWVSYKEMVKLARGVAVFVPATVENDFKITAEQLEAAITPNTKVILYSSPCNPSGSVYSRDELFALAKVIARYPNILVISDEIYELINFEGHHESIAQFDFIRNQVIIVNGVSKGFAMTGWRLGYLAAPLAIAKACDKLQGQMTSATCSISQYAAIEAMQTDPNSNAQIREMIATFKARKEKMLGMIRDIPGFITHNPQGAFYFFPNVTYYFGKSSDGKVINNAGDLSNYLLDKANVATVPGDAFGDPNCIRLSYATSMDLLTKAVERIRLVLAELK